MYDGSRHCTYHAFATQTDEQTPRRLSREAGRVLCVGGNHPAYAPCRVRRGASFSAENLTSFHTGKVGEGCMRKPATTFCSRASSPALLRGEARMSKAALRAGSGSASKGRQHVTASESEGDPLGNGQNLATLLGPIAAHRCGLRNALCDSPRQSVCG